MIRVTELLAEAGLIDRTWFSEEGALRGQYVHQACHYYDMGELDEDSLDPVLIPYVEGWKKFREDTGVMILRCEERIDDNRLGVTGMPDRVVDWPGVGYAVIDIKSGSLQPWTAIQLAAYRLLIVENWKPMVGPKRFAVNLPGDGTYKVKEYKDRADEGIFLAALAIHNWKKNHGGK
jgi:hypothetical protein